MLGSFVSFFTKQGMRGQTIKASHDLYNELSDEEIRTTELDQILEKFKKTGFYDAAKLKRLLDSFIVTVTDILQKLEASKRRVEAIEYKKLQELQQMVSAEQSIKISKKLRELELNLFSGISHQTAKESIDELRVSANRQPAGYFIKKMRSSRGILADILRRSSEDSLEDSAQILSRLTTLIAANRDKVNFASIEPQFIGALELYRKSFWDNFQIEVDIEIEEARLLHLVHRYSEYAKMLKLEEYHVSLERLIKRADFFVQQDAVNTKQLRRMSQTLYELTGQVHFAETAQATVFSDVQPMPYNIGPMAGTLYVNNRKKNGKGVVVVASFFSSRTQFDLLSKRIADEGYEVLAIDLPSQGESQGTWQVGLMAEFVSNSVRALRQSRGLGKVAVAGLSIGAIASLFAALSYNRKIEETLYQLYGQYTALLSELESYEKYVVEPEKFMSPGYHQETQKIKAKLEATYIEIKQAILESLQSGRFDSGRIDSFILLSSFARLQEAMPVPPQVVAMIGKINKNHLRFILNNFINKPLTWPILKPKHPDTYRGPSKDSRYLELYFLKVPEHREFINYILTVENPIDYINLLTFFEKKSEFVREFLNNIVRAHPKIFITGGWDSNLRFPGRKKRQEELDAVYSLFGNHRMVNMPDIGHPLVSGTKFGVGRGQVVEDPRVVKEILAFLESSLKGM